MNSVSDQRSGPLPLVSVVMPVRNEEALIERSLTSLQIQTYDRFEIVLIDDGCTDGTLDVVRRMALPNLRIIPGPQAGLHRALQVGVASAKGDIIIRQDADDMSHPERIRRQVSFLVENPLCVVVGAWANVHNEQGQYVSTIRNPITDAAIRLRLTVETAFAHPSVAIRKSALMACGGYLGPESMFPEDFDLWSRIQREGQLANIPVVLVDLMSRPAGITRSAQAVIGRHAGQIAADNLSSFTELPSTAQRLTPLMRNYYAREKCLHIRDAMYLLRMLIRARLSAGIWRARGGYKKVYYLKPLAWVIRRPSSIGAGRGGLPPGGS